MMNLQELRNLKNMTQDQMAKYLEIGVSTYNQYENSQRNIPTDVAKKISDILNVKLEDIFLPTKFTVSKNNYENEATSSNK